MSETFETSTPTTCVGSPNATSSPVSGSGRTLSGEQDGPTTGRSGQGVARASLSARQAEEAGLLTSGTFGLTGSTSSRSAVLQRSLASRLHQRTASHGSILYKLTWKERVTPSGRVICALRASAVPTSANGSILLGWPTATTRDWKDGANPDVNVPLNALLGRVAWLAGWPTPLVNDTTGSTHCYGKRKADGSRPEFQKLPGAARMATPMRLCSDGTLLTGSTAGMAAGGRLHPEHSRWLMRLPPEWDDCAPMETRSTRKRRPSS